MLAGLTNCLSQILGSWKTWNGEWNKYYWEASVTLKCYVLEIEIHILFSFQEPINFGLFFVCLVTNMCRLLLNLVVICILLSFIQGDLDLGSSSSPAERILLISFPRPRLLFKIKMNIIGFFKFCLILLKVSLQVTCYFNDNEKIAKIDQFRVPDCNITGFCKVISSKEIN